MLQGAVTWPTEGPAPVERVYGEHGPRIEPAPPSADGSLEFMATIRWREGAAYWTGRAVVGHAEDGRLVIKSLEFLDHWSHHA